MNMHALSCDFLSMKNRHLIITFCFDSVLLYFNLLTQQPQKKMKKKVKSATYILFLPSNKGELLPLVTFA